MSPLLPKHNPLVLLGLHITEKTGIGFDEQRRKQLGQIINGRCKILGLDNIEDYYTVIRTSGEAEGEFGRLMDILTIQESSFFRQKAQFDALKNFCLPELLKKRKADRGRINIWSAGCANGEEAYSIAMLLWEICPRNPKETFHIIATDISRKALQKAKKGIYSKKAIRNLAPRFVDRYFTEEKKRYVLSERIRTMVDFKYLNLAEEPFPRGGVPKWDIIFCRNVIIYFTNDHSRRLLKRFYQVMADGGFLFAGFSETLKYLNNDFIPIQLDNAFIYQKDVSAVSKALKATPPAKTSRKRPAHEKTGFIRPQQNLTPNGPTLSGKNTTSMKKTGSGDGVSFNTPMSAGVKELASPDTRDRPSGTAESLDKRLALARELADNGEILESAALLDHITQQDPLQTEAYLLLAMIYRNTGNLHQSGLCLKKAIYLQPENALARLHLADIYRESARKTDAAREYANVISLLESRKDLEDDTFGEGFTRKAILTAARAHLKRVDSD